MSRLLVFAGPNGSGKSTVTSTISVIGSYVNADVIKSALGCNDEEAAEIAENTRTYFLKRGADFTFETVLSTPRNLKLMAEAKSKGYHVACIYVLTIHPKINIARVALRVKCGGHDVPVDKIISRYIRALRLFPELFKVCDELYVFDNSADAPNVNKSMILSYVNGKVTAYDNPFWNHEMLSSLVHGSYPENYIRDA